MKDIISFYDSELQAISFGLMEIYNQLLNQKCFTKNEEKIKAVLNDKLCRVIDAVTALQAVVTKLKDMDEFEMMHVIDVEELINSEK